MWVSILVWRWVLFMVLAWVRLLAVAWLLWENVTFRILPVLVSISLLSIVFSCVRLCMCIAITPRVRQLATIGGRFRWEQLRTGDRPSFEARILCLVIFRVASVVSMVVRWALPLVTVRVVAGVRAAIFSAIRVTLGVMFVRFLLAMASRVTFVVLYVFGWPVLGLVMVGVVVRVTAVVVRVSWWARGVGTDRLGGTTTGNSGLAGVWEGSAFRDGRRGWGRLRGSL